MISGTLSNNTVWWISRDEKNVWIESKELENQKFIDKEYGIEKDRIFGSKPRRQVGELTGSKLERRLYKDAWRIKLEAFLDIYPDLASEIKNKSIEEKKKKRQKKSRSEPKTKPNFSTLHQVLSKETEKIKEKGQKDEQEKLIQKEQKDEQEKLIQKEQKDEQEKLIQKDEQENKKSYFDVTCPYIEWIKREIDKSPDGELKIFSNDMKENMGKEYLNMHDMRIYLGLNKVLPEIGIDVKLGKIKGKGALIMKRNK